MQQLFAIFLILVSAIYSDMDSGNLFQAFVLPVVLVSALAYLFWFRGFLAISVIAFGVYHSDLESSGMVEGILWPAVTFVAFVYLMIWMARMASRERTHDIQAGGGHFNDGGSFGGDGGCDGGGGGD